MSVDTLLRQAVQAGSIDGILSAVRQGANVNARDEGGETALTYATSRELEAERAASCVRCLLSLGARVSEERPGGGLGTSVHGAAGCGYTEALKELLSVDARVSFNSFDDMSRTELVDGVRAAIQTLPPLYREVIVLCDLQELDYSSAAAVIECPVGTVRSRLHRARMLLRARLENVRSAALFRLR